MADAPWPALRRQLSALPQDELLELLEALCRRSADNRRFLAARLRGDDDSAALEEYRARVLEEFAAAPARTPRLGAARKAIRDYRRASSDLPGSADLWLAFLDAGTELGRRHDDLGEAYYGSLAVGLRDLVALLRESPELRGACLPRLRELRDRARRVGWTWGATLGAAVDELE